MSADPEVTIHLVRVPANKVGSKEDYFKIVHEAYTTQYLQKLGVEPTEKHKKTVARNSPLDKCEIEATWTEDSAIAGTLRISQPPVGVDLRAAKATNRRASGDNARMTSRKWNEANGYFNVVPPTVEHAANLNLTDGGRSGQGNQDQQHDPSRENAIFEMRTKDVLASSRADATLVEELDTLRRWARGEIDMRNEPQLIQWGEEGERELASLKMKFILPFAALRPVRKGSQEMMLQCWQSTQLRTSTNIPVFKDLVAEMSVPIQVTLEHIAEEAKRYTENQLPLELLTSRKDPWLFAAIRERLESPEATRLTGLLSHLLYWTVFGHLHKHERRLPHQTRQSLVLTVQELWSQFVEPARTKLGRRGELLARDSPAGISFVFPVFIVAIKRGVEHVFHFQYQKPLSDPDYGAELSLRLVDQLNVLTCDLFDPDCCYASFGTLDSTMEAIRLWKRHNVSQMKLGITSSTKMLSREFRTSPAVFLLMHGDSGGPVSAKTRKLLQKSKSDTILQALNGPVLDSPARARKDKAEIGTPIQGPRFDEAKRTMLYRTTCSRLQSTALEVITGNVSSSWTKSAVIAGQVDELAADTEASSGAA